MDAALSRFHINITLVHLIREHKEKVNFWQNSTDIASNIKEMPSCASLPQGEQSLRSQGSKHKGRYQESVYWFPTPNTGVRKC